MSMISELTRKLRDKSYCSMFPPKFCELLSQAADTIEELSAKLSAAQMERSSQYYHGGWVPCEEQMPEDGEYVLVWYEYFRFGNYNCMYQTFGIGYQYDGHWSGDVNGVKARCIAWRPLPEPYREVRDETD